MGRAQKGLLRARSLDLQKDRLSPAYRNRLEAAGERFRRWCELRGTVLEHQAAHPQHVVPLLVDYLQVLFDQGVAYWWALHAVLYVQTEWRELRGHLTQAWDSVATWRMHLPVTSRVPLRLELLRALCYAAAVHVLVLDPPRCCFWLCFALSAGERDCPCASSCVGVLFRDVHGFQRVSAPPLRKRSSSDGSHQANLLDMRHPHKVRMRYIAVAQHDAVNRSGI